MVNEVKNEVNNELTHAVNDFILGKGQGNPSQSICEVLIQQHPIINKFIVDALKNKTERISIMPFENTIQCYTNPVFYGICSTTLPIMDPNSNRVLEVNFDRN